MYVWLDIDERYPDYDVSLRDEFLGRRAWVHGHTVTRWLRIINEYTQVQQEIAKVYGKVGED